MSKMTQYNCKTCNKEIYRTPSRVSDNMFCSVTCRGKYFCGENNNSKLQSIIKEKLHCSFLRIPTGEKI